MRWFETFVVVELGVIGIAGLLLRGTLESLCRMAVRNQINREGVIMELLERLKAVRAAHEKDHAKMKQEIADRDARIADLEAKLAAGVLTADEETELKALEDELGTNPATPPA